MHVIEITQSWCNYTEIRTKHITLSKTELELISKPLFSCVNHVENTLNDDKGNHLINHHFVKLGEEKREIFIHLIEWYKDSPHTDENIKCENIKIGKNYVSTFFKNCCDHCDPSTFKTCYNSSWLRKVGCGCQRLDLYKKWS